MFPFLQSLNIWAAGILAWCILLLPQSAYSQSAPSRTQQIPLRAGWNLISIQVGGPISPQLFSNSIQPTGQLIEIWSYAPSTDPLKSGAFTSWQPTISNYPNDLNSLQPGKGYWVNVAQQCTASLDGQAWAGPVVLNPGWNLVGFPGLSLAENEVQGLLSVFGSEFGRISQVWSFDPATNTFPGYDLTSIPAVKSLDGIRPARGYWVYALDSVTLTPEPYIALEPDADASPLEDEVLFSSTNSKWHGSNPAKYVGSNVRYADPEDAEFDLNQNGILDTPFTQDTMRFPVGVDRKIITLGNRQAGVIDWAVVSSIPWLTFETTAGAVSSERDSILLTVNRAGLLPGNKMGDFTVFIGSKTFSVHVILEIPTSSGDWKGYATTQRVNGKNIPIGAVDMGINLFMEGTSNSRFRAVLNKDTSLLFPRDVFMTGVFYSGNDFSLTTNFEMPKADRNAPPFDTFPAKRPTGQAAPAGSSVPRTAAREDSDVNGNGKVDVQNPFPFPVRREITLLGTRKSPDRMEGSYVESITGMLPSNQPVFIEGTFFLDRQSFNPTKRSIFNQATTLAPILIGGTSGQTFRETTINVSSAVSIQGVTLSLNIDFPDPTKLTITLYGPSGQSVVIHRNGTTLPSSIDLSNFNDLLGNGTWRLRVAWTSTGERGYFNSWGLNIQGLATYSITAKIAGNPGGGTVPLSGVHVVLTGSNIIEQTDTGADGSFSIPSLTENNYTLSLSRPGFQTRLVSFFLNNSSLYIGENGASANISELNTPLILTPLDITNSELRAGPFVGQAPLFVNLSGLIKISDLNALGTIQTASWNFGDGSPVILDTASTEDDVAQTAAKHLYTAPGDYTATLTLTGTIGSPLVLQTSIHAQRIAPDGSSGAPAMQMIAAGFVGSFAAPPDNGGNSVQTANVASVDQTISVKQTNGSNATVTLTGVASGLVPQESKRDSATFDIDRPPLSVAANFADFHLTSGDREDTDFTGQPYWSGDGTSSLPFFQRFFADLTSNEQADSSNDVSLGVFATYVPREVNGQPIPERFRSFNTLGGAVFGTEPARVGDFVLQTGRVEP